MVNNRKGKLIFFYEWDILLDWKGSMNDSDEDIEGQIAIPNLSEENKISEVDVSICGFLLKFTGVKSWSFDLCFMIVSRLLSHYLIILRKDIESRSGYTL